MNLQTITIIRENSLAMEMSTVSFDHDLSNFLLIFGDLQLYHKIAEMFNKYILQNEDSESLRCFFLQP